MCLVASVSFNVNSVHVASIFKEFTLKHFSSARNKLRVWVVVFLVGKIYHFISEEEGRTQ